MFAEMFPHGQFSEKHIGDKSFTVFNSVVNNDDDQFAMADWSEKRKKLDYKYIVKFHESFTEGGLVRSFVLEPMIISDLNTLAKVAEQRTAVLRENYVWRFLGMLSAGLAYAHGKPQPIGPVLATDLSPHTVIYSAGQWKLLLLGSKTQHLLAEVRRRVYKRQISPY